jgi:hypothetical protein
MSSINKNETRYNNMDQNEIQNNVQNEDAMKEQKKENRKRVKRVVTWTSIVTIIIIIILLLLRSCGGGVAPGPDTPPTTPPPVTGDFDITDDPVVRPTEPPVVEVVPTITFAGYGKFEVSEKTPKIELKNPDKNAELGVNFIFTVMDSKTGDVIARTPQVAPGKYVYVNVVDYYKTAGKYEVLIKIDTVNNEGVEMNGIEQKMDLIVK